jgi:hypothetical protein
LCSGTPESEKASAKRLATSADNASPPTVTRVRDVHAADRGSSRNNSSIDGTKSTAVTRCETMVSAR